MHSFKSNLQNTPNLTKMDERIELKKEVAGIGKRIDDERAEWKKAPPADKPFYERTIDALTAEKAALIARIATFDELVLIKARADALAPAPAPGKNTPSRPRR